MSALPREHEELIRSFQSVLGLNTDQLRQVVNHFSISGNAALAPAHPTEPSPPIAIPIPATPTGTQAQAPPFFPSQPLMMPFPPSQPSQHSGLVPTLFPSSQPLSQSLPPPGYPMQLAAPGAALPVVPTVPSDQFTVGPAAPLPASAPIMNYRSRLPSRAHNSPLAALPASLPVPVTPSFAGVRSLGAGVAFQTTHQRRMASSASTRASAPHGRRTRGPASRPPSLPRSQDPYRIVDATGNELIDIKVKCYPPHVNVIFTLSRLVA